VSKKKKPFRIRYYPGHRIAQLIFLCQNLRLTPKALFDHLLDISFAAVEDKFNEAEKQALEATADLTDTPPPSDPTPEATPQITPEPSLIITP